MTESNKKSQNKLIKAHNLISNYVEFRIEECKKIKLYKKPSFYYEIYADCGLDYALGVCDALNIEHFWDYNFDDEYYKLYIVDLNNN